MPKSLLTADKINTAAMRRRRVQRIMGVNLFTKITTVDAESIYTAKRVHTFCGHVFFKTHHDQVIARDRSIDNKDLKLNVIRVIRIGAFALMLLVASTQTY
jgi:hypothetical protein